MFSLCHFCNKKGKKVLSPLNRTRCINCKKKLISNRKLTLIISKNNKIIFTAKKKQI